VIESSTDTIGYIYYLATKQIVCDFVWHVSSEQDAEVQFI